MTATDTDAAAAVFEQALARDAGTDTTPDVAAPPRLPERDPDAPFGRDESGAAIAPHGFKANGVPRQKPGGPGRKPAAEAPRVATAADAAPAGGGPKDYTKDLMAAGLNVWVAGSMVRGGKLPLVGVRVPDLRPYAAHWNGQLPTLAAAWNAAAQQNATVRGYVEKFSGDGSGTWVIGVAVASAGFFMGCVEIARAADDVRAELTAANDAQFTKFIQTTVQAAGLVPAGEQ